MASGIGQKIGTDNIPYCNDTHFASYHRRQSDFKPHRLRRFRLSYFHHYGSCASSAHRQSFRLTANHREQHPKWSDHYSANLSRQPAHSVRPQDLSCGCRKIENSSKDSRKVHQPFLRWRTTQTPCPRQLRQTVT